MRNFPIQPWSGRLSYREFGNSYDPAVGFSRRNSFRRVEPRIRFSPLQEKSSLIREFSWEISFENLMSLDWKRLTQNIRLTPLSIRFESGDEIPTERFIQTRIEAEIAFCMKGPLAGEVTREEVLQATDYVFPSLEILDTRIFRKDENTGKMRTVFDTISDNAANAGVISGAQKNDPQKFDLRRVGSIVMRNNEVEETGLGAGVLNDPITGIIWLVKRLSEYNQKISPGEIILSGSFIRPIEARKGDEFYADFGDFGFVECKFN